MRQINEYYQKEIRSFERAYVRKQRALDNFHIFEDRIANHLGFSDRKEMNHAAWSSKDMDSHRDSYSSASRELGITSSMQKCMREVQLANRILGRTKYTYWHFNPKGTAIVNQYGKFTYNA